MQLNARQCSKLATAFLVSLHTCTQFLSCFLSLLDGVVLIAKLALAVTAVNAAVVLRLVA